VTTSDDSAELPDDVAALSYEQARDELVEVVSRLEQGQVTWERLDSARKAADE
jgi:exodeoxyribonuclease VII small subunit